MLHIKTTLLFLFVFCRILVAQEFSFKNINTDHGLPSSEVYDILEDKHGYMWFATDHGIARYNGKEFTTYTTANGLLDNTVFRMCEDSKGRIWFASQSNELCYWQNNRIHKIPGSEHFRTVVFKQDIITMMLADSSDNIWVGTTRSIYYFEAIKKYAEFQTIPVDTSVADHFIVVNDKILFSYNVLKGHAPKKGDKYSRVLLNFHKYKAPNHYDDIKFPLDGAHYPYGFRTFGYTPKNETYLFALDSLLFILRKNRKVEFKKFDHRIVNIITDSHRGLWFGLMKGGVSYYKNGDLSQPPITFLNGLTVDDVCIDHEGGAWIATLEKGVFYIPSTSILVYSNIPFLNDHITFIGEINNKILVNTFGNAISEKNNQGFKPVDYMCDLVKSKSSLYYAMKSRDTTYLSYASELIRFTSDHKQVPLKNKTDLTKFSAGKFILETEDKHIWMGYGGGLKKINNLTDLSIIYHSPFRVTCAIAVGKDILVGGKKGLFKFKDSVYSSLSYIDTLLSSQISQLAKSKDGSIWISTIGNGLLRLKDNKVLQLTEKNGLISNSCTAVTTDQYENVWVGTNKGLSCVYKVDTKNKWVIKNITKQNGLNSNEITKLFAFNDTLWVGTMAGLNSFNIIESLTLTPPSPAYISSIKVNDKELSTDTTVFSYNENNITFVLEGLTFKDEREHLYRYRLIGLNDTWQHTLSNELLFNNLAPGKYTFEVKVGNTDKIWSKSSSIYSFTIKKPFWLRWWFILLEILTIILIVYLIILWRSSIIRKKEQEKLRINKLLTEYQMKALTAQMNPHFIFNAINSIQNFIIQNHSTLAYDYLIKFSKLIRLVLNNSKDNEVTIQQELDTLALYIELEQLRFENSFDYILKVDPEIDVGSLMIPGLLLQPYIENAIWHGLMPLKTRKGKIALTICRENELLKITVTDNGVGRTVSDQIKKKIVHKSHQSIGMELTGKRIELFGKESKFSLQIIDNYDDTGLATGTSVEIILPMIEMY